MEEREGRNTRLLGAGTTVETRSVHETERFARQLAETLRPGNLVLLFGDLGSGKTAFVRGLADGLGAEPDEVSSPTFTLVQEHRGRCRLQHVDLYRVQPGAEVDELGLDEFMARGDVVVVEWADRLEDVPDHATVVTISDLGGDRRQIKVVSCS